MRGTFGREFVQGDAALTLARGAGKSTFIAGLGSACLDGPLVEENSEAVVIVPSLAQSRIIFSHVILFLFDKYPLYRQACELCTRPGAEKRAPGLKSRSLAGSGRPGLAGASSGPGCPQTLRGRGESSQGLALRLTPSPG